MLGAIQTVELISKSMDELIDFIVKDEFLGKQFEDFLIKNKIEIQKESELNDVLIDYLLSGRLNNGKLVLDYFEEKNPNTDKNILYSLKKSFISVFQIKKITKNSYETFDIISEKDFTLIPLVKTASLRGIGLYDYIKARIIEFQNNFYLLEIHDSVGQFRKYNAYLDAAKLIIQNTKTPVLYNKDNLLKIKNTISSFHSSFMECFKKDEIIISNKDADKFLENFYNFHLGEVDKIEFKELGDDFNYKFFDISEYGDSFINNALFGFSRSEEEYDVGIFSDNEYGLYIVPFLGTLNHSLFNNLKLENEDELISEFLLDSKVSPNLLRKKADKDGKFLQKINKITKNNYNNIDEVINTYKEGYKDGLKHSAISVLYSSKIIEKILGHKEEETNKEIGRNDLCPCGSGKKYKKCCLNKQGV